MTIRLLIYTHSFEPSVGGVETVVMSLATGLASLGRMDGSAGLDITVATSTPRGELDDASLPFRVVRRPRLPHLVRLIRVSDVVHLAGPCFLPMMVGLLFQKPMIVEHHGFQSICPNGQLLYEPTQKPCPGHFMAGRHGECIRCNARNGLAHSLGLWSLTFPRRWLCTRAQSNIAPTQWLATLLRLPRTTTIHHGLPVDSRGQCSPASSSPVVAFMGRLVGTKGVATLLRAAHRVKTNGLAFTLRILGDGPQRAELEAQTEALGLADRVNFLGYQPAAKLHKALADVRAIVMPSLAGEVFGLVAAESMMRGALPIVSDGGALAEVVGDTGLTFPPGNDEALAGCLERVLQSPDFENTMRHRAQQRAMKWFTESRMVREHLTLYAKLLADRENPC